MNPLGRLGLSVRTNLHDLLDATGLIGAVLWHAPRPWYWVRTVRANLGHQVVLLGVDAIPVVLLVGVISGAVGLLELQAWLTRIGVTGRFGEVANFLLIRELGPVLMILVGIGRSGSSLTTSIAHARLQGGARVLDAQGIDPFVYFVMPVVIASTISLFCLSILFVAVALLSGYLAMSFFGLYDAGLTVFLGSVLGTVSPLDLFNFCLKTILPGMAMGAICCLEGLRRAGTTADVRLAGSRAVVRSLGFAMLVAAAVSVASYL